MTCRCPACSPEVAPTYSEEFRLACEIRYLTALPSGIDRSRYLAGVRAKRGEQARAELVKALHVVHGEREAA